VTVAALLAVIALGPPPPAILSHEHVRRAYKIRLVCRRGCRRRVRWRRLPIRVPAPAPPGPRPTPTPTPVPLPSRTSVDLDEWRVTPAYRVLAAGNVEFNAANLGEDDHDFSVGDAPRANLVTVALGPGQSDSVRLTLGAGVYTLYCSLPTHEEQGMRAEVTVR
jgi:Copper binding proteins, plastocyanin/azurin family